jgi:hypothetical protein
MAPSADLREVYREVLYTLARYYEAAYAVDSRATGRVAVLEGDARTFGVRGGVDYVITSPPYPNRLDYRRVYGPELAFLAAVGHSAPPDAIVGTNAVRGYASFQAELQSVCSAAPQLADLLEAVRQRQIGGERRSDYYVKYYTRYFADLFAAFGNAVSTLRPGGQIIVVTQDNAHRGMTISVDSVLRQYLGGVSMKCTSAGEWPRHHLGKRNVSRRYPAVTHRHVERVLVAEQC